MSSHPTLGEPLAPLNDESSEPGTLGRTHSVSLNKNTAKLAETKFGSASRLSAAVGRQGAEEPASPSSPLALRIRDVCRVTGLGRTTVYKAIKSGALIARRYGRCTIVLAEDLVVFLRNLPTSR
jgi:Helix-turn-helix domain